MDPQERSDRRPVIEHRALKEPRSGSLMVGLARNVVIRGRVRGRKPFEDVLRYLCPWKEDSVFTTDAIVRVGDYKHFTSITSRFTSPISFAICCTIRLVFSAPGPTRGLV